MPQEESEYDPSEPDKEREPETISEDLLNSAKGFAMGICDAVPGVSGGTVALVVGIYERLFTAISRIDRTLFGHVRQRQWRLAYRHVDARFLFALLVGIVVGYGVMSILIKKLMASDTLRPFTLASFAGMILGSLWVVTRMIKLQNRKHVIACVLWGTAGFGLSLWIAMQNYRAASEFDHLYVFSCAIVAICAMILPGISGAMILLILGAYYSVLEIPGELIRFQNVGTNLLRLFVFATGCFTGLMLFGRVVKWALMRFRNTTLSTMLGLMCGSLVLLWPFQNRIEPENPDHKPTYESFLPDELGTALLGSLVCIFLFASLVVIVDRCSHRDSGNESV